MKYYKLYLRRYTHKTHAHIADVRICVYRPRRTDCLARRYFILCVGGSSLTRGEKATEFSVGGSPGRRDAAMLRVLRAVRCRRLRWWCRGITALLPPPPKERSAPERAREMETKSEITHTHKRGRPGGAACTTHTRTRIALLLIYAVRVCVGVRACTCACACTLSCART